MRKSLVILVIIAVLLLPSTINAGGNIGAYVEKLENKNQELLKKNNQLQEEIVKWEIIGRMAGIKNTNEAKTEELQNLLLQLQEMEGLKESLHKYKVKESLLVQFTVIMFAILAIVVIKFVLLITRKPEKMADPESDEQEFVRVVPTTKTREDVNIDSGKNEPVNSAETIISHNNNGVDNAVNATTTPLDREEKVPSGNKVAKEGASPSAEKQKKDIKPLARTIGEAIRDARNDPDGRRVAECGIVIKACEYQAHARICNVCFKNGKTCSGTQATASVSMAATVL